MGEMEFEVQQVTFTTDTAFLSGRMVRDTTKVVVAAMEVESGLLAAVRLTVDGPYVVEAPDEAIVEILEVPPKRG